MWMGKTLEGLLLSRGCFPGVVTSGRPHTRGPWGPQKAWLCRSHPLTVPSSRRAHFTHAPGHLGGFLEEWLAKLSYWSSHQEFPAISPNLHHKPPRVAVLGTSNGETWSPAELLTASSPHGIPGRWGKVVMAPTEVAPVTIHRAWAGRQPGPHSQSQAKGLLVPRVAGPAWS